MMAPPAAHAVTLVSNIGQPNDDDYDIIGVAGSFNFTEVQPFTTGDHANGYTLASVDFDIREFAGSDAIRVSIYTSNASDQPGTSVYVLTNPATITNDALNTFTAPANAILESETTYHVVVEAPSGDFDIRLVNSYAEDAVSASGWSISDTKWSKASDGGAWELDGNILRLKIEGTANVTRRFVSNTDQTPITLLASVGVGNVPSDDYTQAQQFTTGSHANGYTLSAVELEVWDTREIVLVDPLFPRVSIYTNTASDQPGTSVYVLANPARLISGVLNTFTAPANATLASNTAYHVVVDAPSGNFGLGLTESDAEDAVSASGWSIRDTRWSKTSDGGTWASEAESLHFRVTGAVGGTTIGARLALHEAMEQRNGNIHYQVDLTLGKAVPTRVRDLRDHGFTLTNGTLHSVKRIHRDTKWHDGAFQPFSNHFRMTVKPTDKANATTVSLPSLPCSEQGAVCTADGKGLGNAPLLTLGEDGSGPITLAIEDASAAENNLIEGFDHPQITFPITLSRASPSPVRVDFQILSTGTATEGVDYWPQDFTVLVVPGRTTVAAGVLLIPDTETDAGETIDVRISNARLTTDNWERSLTITTAEATGTILDGSGKRVARPGSPQLAQNAPNPFNSQTVICLFPTATGFGALGGLRRERPTSGGLAARAAAGWLSPASLAGPRRRRASRRHRPVSVSTGDRRDGLDAQAHPAAIASQRAAKQ